MQTYYSNIMPSGFFNHAGEELYSLTVRVQGIDFQSQALMTAQELEDNFGIKKGGQVFQELLNNGYGSEG